MAKEPEKKKDTTYGNLKAQTRTIEQLKKAFFQVTTGSLIFDIFTSGGYSPGIARFAGPSEHGKTLQALEWAKNWLEHWGDKGEVHYFDCEGRLTPMKLNLSGITKVKDFDKKFTAYIYNVYEDIGQFVYDLTMNNPDGKHYFFIFDSLDMMISQKDYDKNFGEAEKVGAAQVISTLLAKKVGPYMADKGHFLYVCSQIRAKISTGPGGGQGPKTQMSGGNALLHASNLTAKIAKLYSDLLIFENPTGGTLKEKGNIVGRYHTMTFEKTMNEKTGQTIKIPIKTGAGIWREREIVDLTLMYSLISKKGAWFLLNEDWAKRINADVLPIKQERFIEEKIKEATEAAEKKGETLSKTEVKKLKESLKDEAAKVTFEVEKTWQGYPTLFAYIEKEKDVAAWMEKEIRRTFLADSVAFELEEPDTTFE